MCALRHPEDGYILWGSRNDNDYHKISVFKANVPKRWGNLYTDYGELLATDTPWDDAVITNVTQGTNVGHTQIDIAAGFTTGIAALKNLATPINITRAKRIGMLIRSSVLTASGDLKLELYDQVDGTKEHSPSGLKLYDLHATKPFSPDSILHRDSDTATSFEDMTAAYDGLTSTVYTDVTGSTAHSIYIGYANKFDRLVDDLGTVNANASVLTVSYWNGASWVALTLADNAYDDGTILAGATLGKDGSITWTNPGDWHKNTLNLLEYYWVRLSWSNALTNNMTFEEIKISNAARKARAREPH